jgi:hypothetical protein
MVTKAPKFKVFALIGANKAMPVMRALLFAAFASIERQRGSYVRQTKRSSEYGPALQRAGRNGILSPN